MGPLDGIRIIEIAGIGPAPFAAMMLGDMGADVIRVDRADLVGTDPERPSRDASLRSRRSIGVDLKSDEGAGLVLDLVAQSDGIIEGFRPGVMERLGLGPDACAERNPRLVYGRMTGWGQNGPLARTAGHDINYISLAGALYPIGRSGDRPTPPLNLVGDFGGGGMLLAFGMVCGILEARSSGLGQVIDAAMIDGSALLTTMFHGMRAAGLWTDDRSSNLLDTAAPFYDVYETADGEFISIGSLEPQFYAELLTKIDWDPAELPAQMDMDAWPEMKQRFERLFRSRTREEWIALLEGTDVCFAPVLSMAEAPTHPHNVAQGTFTSIDGTIQPAPAPKFSRSQAAAPKPPPRPGRDTEAVLAELGVEPAEISRLRSTGAIR